MLFQIHAPEACEPFLTAWHCADDYAASRKPRRANYLGQADRFLWTSATSLPACVKSQLLLQRLDLFPSPLSIDLLSTLYFLLIDEAAVLHSCSEIQVAERRNDLISAN